MKKEPSGNVTLAHQHRRFTRLLLVAESAILPVSNPHIGMTLATTAVHRPFDAWSLITDTMALNTTTVAYAEMVTAFTIADLRFMAGMIKSHRPFGRAGKLDRWRCFDSNGRQGKDSD